MILTTKVHIAVSTENNVIKNIIIFNALIFLMILFIHFSLMVLKRFFQSSLQKVTVLCLLVCLPSFAQISNNASNEQLKPLFTISCPNFQQTVENYQKKFVVKMENWSSTHLSQAHYQTVFYPFSGPDIVTAMTLYPKANYYVLVADQVPEYAFIRSPEQLKSSSQEFECQMLTNYSRRGYYLTNDLIGKNGPKPRFIKLLIYNLAFAKAQINEVQILSINAEGRIFPLVQGQEPHGVRFLIETKDGRAVTVDYISANISDSGLKNSPHFVKAFERKSQEAVLIKSASHLLQNSYFSTMKTILVERPQWLTQDETGLDIVPLSENYQLQLFGKFITPNRLWEKSPSAQRLAKYYEDHPSNQELPFLLGYEKSGGSMLMIGQRKKSVKE